MKFEDPARCNQDLAQTHMKINIKKNKLDTINFLSKMALPIYSHIDDLQGFPNGSSTKNICLQCRRHRRLGFDPWVGKTPGRSHGNPLQHSCLENPMDRGAWCAIVHGVAKSQTQLKRLSTYTQMSEMPSQFVSFLAGMSSLWGLRVELNQGKGTIPLLGLPRGTSAFSPKAATCLPGVLVYVTDGYHLDACS